MPHPQSLNPVVLAEYKAYREKRLTQYLKLDLTGTLTIVTCLICKDAMQIAQKDEFVPYRILTVDTKFGGIRQKMLKNNKEALKFFQEKHWESCIDRF